MSVWDTYTRTRDTALRNGENARAEEQQNALLATRQQAGNALAGGDYKAGANALLQGGDLTGGLSVLGAQRTAQTAEREMTLADNARAKTEVLGYAQGLLRLPEEQWGPTFSTEIAPKLVTMGIPQATIDRVASDGLTRQEVEYFISTLGGEVAAPRYLQGQRGALDVIDPYSNELKNVRQAERENAPTGFRWNAEGTGVEPIPGYIEGRSSVSAATRAPPRARASGGSRGGSSAPRRNYSPSAIQWD